jgi:hypothetical protein
MNLEELIYKRLSEAKNLTKYLTRYAGQPAIFTPEAPGDRESGWGRATQYPRAVFNFDMQADGERKSAGTLSVALICRNDSEAVPELIEPAVKKALKDVLLKDDNGTLYAFAWARTEGFSMTEEKNELLIGSEIRFDIMEYPQQETTDPDPIMAMARYIKDLYPDSIVVGIDKMADETEASKEAPVFYCRLTEIEKLEETNTVVWMNGKIAISLLCPDGATRLKMAAAVLNSLSLDGEVTMLDDSPMFMEGLTANLKSDYLKDGQIFVTGRYGLLRYKAVGYPLRHPNINY